MNKISDSGEHLWAIAIGQEPLTFLVERSIFTADGGGKH